MYVLSLGLGLGQQEAALIVLSQPECTAHSTSLLTTSAHCMSAYGMSAHCMIAQLHQHVLSKHGQHAHFTHMSGWTISRTCEHAPVA